jgi:hypothetical protein
MHGSPQGTLLMADEARAGPWSTCLFLGPVLQDSVLVEMQEETQTSDGDEDLIGVSVERLGGQALEAAMCVWCS